MDSPCSNQMTKEGLLEKGVGKSLKAKVRNGNMGNRLWTQILPPPPRDPLMLLRERGKSITNKNMVDNGSFDRATHVRNRSKGRGHIPNVDSMIGP